MSSNDPSALADFEDGEAFDRAAIEFWADTTGNLPTISAHEFARWLDREWNDYDDGSGTQTNEQILKGALEFWTGRA